MSKKQYTHNKHRQDSSRNSLNVHYAVDPHKQRVTQTNMIYLIGLPESIADQELLKLDSYCGQYGKITKVLVKKNFINDYSSFSAYVTFEEQQSASIAIIGLNNFISQKNRIYASYGTNKYCSAFIRFGKCRKQDCPFLHRIQKDKEIRQEDNKKLFQQQQESARKYFIENHQNMEFIHFQDAVFPSKFQIRQWFIQQGSIKLNKQQNEILRQESIQRQNALKENASNCSTQYSPLKDPQQNLQLINQDEANEAIIKRMNQKVKCTKKSMFFFAKEQNSTDEYQLVTKKLKDYILESIV